MQKWYLKLTTLGSKVLRLDARGTDLAPSRRWAYIGAMALLALLGTWHFLRSVPTVKDPEPLIQQITAPAPASPVKKQPQPAPPLSVNIDPFKAYLQISGETDKETKKVLPTPTKERPPALPPPPVALPSLPPTPPSVQIQARVSEPPSLSQWIRSNGWRLEATAVGKERTALLSRASQVGLYRQGETLEGSQVRIAEIKPGQVVLVRGQEKIVLEVKP